MADAITQADIDGLQALLNGEDPKAPSAPSNANGQTTTAPKERTATSLTAQFAKNDPNYKATNVAQDAKNQTEAEFWRDMPGYEGASQFLEKGRRVKDSELAQSDLFLEKAIIYLKSKDEAPSFLNSLPRMQGTVENQAAAKAEIAAAIQSLSQEERDKIVSKAIYEISYVKNNSASTLAHAHRMSGNSISDQEKLATLFMEDIDKHHSASENRGRHVKNTILQFASDPFNYLYIVPVGGWAAATTLKGAGKLAANAALQGGIGALRSKLKQDARMQELQGEDGQIYERQKNFDHSQMVFEGAMNAIVLPGAREAGRGSAAGKSLVDGFAMANWKSSAGHIWTNLRSPAASWTTLKDTVKNKLSRTYAESAEKITNAQTAFQSEIVNLRRLTSAGPHPNGNPANTLNKVLTSLYDANKAMMDIKNLKRVPGIEAEYHGLKQSLTSITDAKTLAQKLKNGTEALTNDNIDKLIKATETALKQSHKTAIDANPLIMTRRYFAGIPQGGIEAGQKYGIGNAWTALQRGVTAPERVVLKGWLELAKLSANKPVGHAAKSMMATAVSTSILAASYESATGKDTGIDPLSNIWGGAIDTAQLIPASLQATLNGIAWAPRQLGLTKEGDWIDTFLTRNNIYGGANNIVDNLQDPITGSHGVSASYPNPNEITPQQSMFFDIETLFKTYNGLDSHFAGNIEQLQNQALTEAHKSSLDTLGKHLPNLKQHIQDIDKKLAELGGSVNEEGDYVPGKIATLTEKLENANNTNTAELQEQLLEALKEESKLRNEAHKLNMHARNLLHSQKSMEDIGKRIRDLSTSLLRQGNTDIENNPEYKQLLKLYNLHQAPHTAATNHIAKVVPEIKSDAEIAADNAAEIKAQEKIEQDWDNVTFGSPPQISKDGFDPYTPANDSSAPSSSNGNKHSNIVDAATNGKAKDAWNYVAGKGAQLGGGIQDIWSGMSTEGKWLTGGAALLTALLGGKQLVQGTAEVGSKLTIPALIIGALFGGYNINENLKNNSDTNNFAASTGNDGPKYALSEITDNSITSNASHNDNSAPSQDEQVLQAGGITARLGAPAAN